MNEKMKKIYKKFDGKLVGKYPMKVHICRVLSSMPEEIIHMITKSCWFMGTMEDAWAFTFTGNDLKDQHLIFLSDELLFQDEKQIHYSIAHEIGHVFLGHKNSTLIQQSKSEVRKQESEADTFAKQYVDF